MAPAALTASVLAALVAERGATGVPNWHGCVEDRARELPYCDTRLPVETRIDDLLSRMTLEEKLAQLGSQAVLGVGCAGVSRGKAGIGLPPWMWISEANTGVSSACFKEGRCVTTFVGPLGIAASFNRTVWFLKGSTLGGEQRAMNNIGGERLSRGSGLRVGLTGFGPNINIARDPRFGRSSELPGEDPLLSGEYAYHVVSGMQERDAGGYPKVAAFLQHFTAYSTEANRGRDNYAISAFDLFDSYLPQYELAFRASPAGVMCSYTGVNGHPSCANGWLLNEVLRSWSPDAMVVTDCGAVEKMKNPPVLARDSVEASAYALTNGSDFAVGTAFDSVAEAIRRGLASEARVDEAARRAFRVHFGLGRFDPVEASEWAQFPIERINSSIHQRVSREAALQSFVLLKNEGVLPLAAGSRIAVVGPQAVARKGLFPGHAGDEFCFGGGDDCIVTIAEALAAENAGGSTSAAPGVGVSGAATAGVEAALAAAAAADAVVLALGIDASIEREGLDRADTALPGLQQEFALRVLALLKPTVLVLTNGGALAIDALVSRSPAAPYAIVEAFSPAFGAPALAASLFGRENRWGKLPVTLYPHSFVSEKAMADYDMSSGVGRTYRYYTGTPLFPFGWGLSLTAFSMSCQEAFTSPAEWRYRCLVRNQGPRDGDEVVLVYHSAADIGPVRHPVPRRSLVDFARTSLRVGEASALDFTVVAQQLALVNEAGRREVYPGKHRLVFSRGHGPEAAFELSAGPQEMVV